MSQEVSLAPEPALTFAQKVKRIIGAISQQEQVPCPLKHHFAPGVYIREIFMPAGTIVIGKIHRTEHFNIIHRGKAYLIDEDGSVELGPSTFVSKAGVQKTLYIEEDTVWSTVHLTDLRDLEALEAQLIEPDDYPVWDRTEERQAIIDAAQKEQRMITQENQV